MRPAVLLVDGVRTRPVLVADRFVDRLRGLVGRPGDAAMAIPGWSVHGWGLHRAVWAVGIDAEGTVLSVSRLRPFGLRVVPGAVWMLELPVVDRPPVAGSTVGFLLGCGRCPDV
jgi:hypothetical protein